MPSLCASCKNKSDADGAPTCPAFPQSIPDAIFFDGGDHRELWPGQEGLTVHELKTGKEQEFEDWVFTYVLPAE